MSVAYELKKKRVAFTPQRSPCAIVVWMLQVRTLKSPLRQSVQDRAPQWVSSNCQE